MNYGSVCSGIEAATVAWHGLGWKASFFSEIEKFPREVLQHHYTDIPLHGDFTTIGKDEYEPIRLLVGGTPCQSFSIAGLRKGLDDERGNLALEFLKLAQRKSPAWLVWENVPGVLSSNGGRDFGAFLGGLVELGYGFAYRVLDAQFFGVPQRRRRVFVVGYLGDWRPAAAVLFERESLSGNSPPRREKRQDVTAIAGTLAANGGGLNRPAGNCNELDFFVTWPAEVTPTLDAHYGDKMGLENQHINSCGGCSSVAKCLTTKTRIDHETETLITTGGVFSDPIALAGNTIGRKPESGGNGNGFDESGTMYTLTKTDRHAVFIHQNQQGDVRESDVSYTTKTVGGTIGQGYQAVSENMQVRRLTPMECERLQGFPDNYTNIKDNCPDGPRYKALGNSMAVPVMKWIGERIQMVDEILKEKSA